MAVGGEEGHLERKRRNEGTEDEEVEGMEERPKLLVQHSLLHALEAWLPATSDARNPPPHTHPAHLIGHGVNG